MRYNSPRVIHILFVVLAGLTFTCCNTPETEYRKITAEEYRDKMKGAWVGQMAGVGWGLPTEFDYIDTIIPGDEVPVWENEMVNQQGNDDLYVEMTFLQSMEKYGTDVSIRQAGIDFANTGYTLWAANLQGRENLRYGIAPPASSHPKYNKNADDIDYQIEADYSGIVAPGMPNVAIQLGEKFGRLMNYGDGLYGGQFVGGMYAEAYFFSSIDSVIAAGLSCIPSESLYARIINDVIKWHRENPENWQQTWQNIMNKYYRDDEYQPFARDNEDVWTGIDSKINGAFIVMGLLYGEGDMEKTIRVSMQCGLDSDCNPSNAAGILGAMMGFEKIPDKFKSALDENKKFSYSNYDFNKLLKVSESFTRRFIIDEGGKIEQKSKGSEVLYVPRSSPVPSAFKPSYDPGVVPKDSLYTPEELEQVEAWSRQHFDTLRADMMPPLEIRHCGKDVKPEFISWNGLDSVFTTTPMDKNRSVRLIMYHESESMHSDKTPYLVFKAGHAPDEEWQLKVTHDGENKTYLISEETTDNQWKNFEFELANEEKIQWELQAENIEKSAINYWGGFDVIYR